MGRGRTVGCHGRQVRCVVHGPGQEGPARVDGNNVGAASTELPRGNTGTSSDVEYDQPLDEEHRPTEPKVQSSAGLLNAERRVFAHRSAT